MNFYTPAYTHDAAYTVCFYEFVFLREMPRRATEMFRSAPAAVLFFCLLFSSQDGVGMFVVC